MHRTLLKLPEHKTLLVSFLNHVRKTDIELSVVERRNDIAARERAQTQIDAWCVRMQKFEQRRQTEAEQRLRRTDRERSLIGGNAVLKVFIFFAAASTSSTYGIRASPAFVRIMCRPLFSKSGTPVSFSSCAMWNVIVDGV